MGGRRPRHRVCITTRASRCANARLRAPCNTRRCHARTTDALRHVRSEVAHRRWPPGAGPIRPRRRSQEVTICSSDSSCWWPWRPRSLPAHRPAQRAHRRRRRSPRWNRVFRARCRASPPRRRDLTTHVRSRRRVLRGPASSCPRCTSGQLPFHAVVTCGRRSVVRRPRDDGDSGRVTRYGLHPSERVRCPPGEGGSG
jgi:hypothetical protein